MAISRGDVSATTQEGSHVAAPTRTSKDRPLIISFSKEEEEFQREVSRLLSFSIISKVIGARPNRAELRDLIQGTLADAIGSVLDVQFLGKGFYHLELETREATYSIKNGWYATGLAAN